MTGIYIHIPFCRRKCHYCNFFSLASRKLKDPFLKALKTEIAFTRDYLAGQPVNTIYFGGGTPSLYDPLVLQEIIDIVTQPRNIFPAEITSPPDPSPKREGRNFSGVIKEITLELNPDDITPTYVGRLKQTSFNRFSIGIQSFSEEDLVYLNRSHSAAQAINGIRLLQEAGYNNLSIDLIYGIPTSTTNRWQKNLELAFSLNVPHISAYALTVEPRTPLAWMIDRQKSAPVSDETQVEQFKILMGQTKINGYQQYEISNFCKPDRHAIHNTSYWKGVPYLGLGPSAHSYNGTSRRWNIANLTKYIDGTEKGECIYEEETLTTAQKYNEYVMTSLRTMWGCDEKMIYDFGNTIYDFFIENTLPLIGKGLVTEDSGVYFLTDHGKLFADRIASELFLT